MGEKLLVELSRPGRQGYSLPALDVPERKTTDLLPKAQLRSELAALPELSEVDVARHFIRLSSLNHHVLKAFYPLGSCTMKYNPIVNEHVSRAPGFLNIHPLQPEETAQGALEVMYELGMMLCELSGMDEITMQPAAGAHGELTGIMIMRAFHEEQNDSRGTILIPDSAHGTNPASVKMGGYDVVQIRSTRQGLIDLDDLRSAMNERVAGMMLTNPNTLGLFETNVSEICGIVHEKGGLMYLDGANLNALCGIDSPGEDGFDIVHFNLHKTFSTPHGGGGPGSGPLGVKEELSRFLPVPVVRLEDGRYRLDYGLPSSIGKIHTFYGNCNVMTKAYAYLRMMGAAGLQEMSECAIINANYVMRNLEDLYDVPYPQHCMHECILSGKRQKEHGIRTLDVAKRLLDYGVHAPTVYFPLIVPEALMIEPTETESRESCDAFIEAMRKIAREAEESPEILKNAPHTTPVGRLNEVKAAKSLDFRWTEDRSFRDR
jgi:glycine dehydrogenase subunit 2